jgi:hypothetical protein
VRGRRDTGLRTASAVAKRIVDAMRSGAFLIGIGVDGFMLNHLTAGMVPSPSLADFVTGVLLLPLFRLVAVCHSIPWDRLVAREHRRKHLG